MVDAKEPTFERQSIADAMGAAIDDIADAAGLADEGIRDALNLLLNATLTYLDHPEGGVDLTDVVERCYDVPLATVIDWINR